MSENRMSDSKFAKRFFTMISLLILLMLVLVVVANINSDEVMTKLEQENQKTIDTVVAERVEPVGALKVGEPPAQVAAVDTAGSGESSGGAQSGEQVYQQACAACHATGVAGAPKFGDEAAWTDRIAQGAETLYSHAINGFQGNAGIMPAKGGNTALGDDVVRAAVDYMVQAVTETSDSAQQSSNVTSPSSAADATAVTEGDSADTTDTGNDAQQSSDGSSTAVSSEAAAVTEAEGDSPDTAADSANGGDVFQQACAMCHTTGVAGAPKVGDIPAWENRIAQGAEMLYNHAINGFQGEAGLMPPKGGNMSLSDDDVRAAVDHMVNQSR